MVIMRCFYTLLVVLLLSTGPFSAKAITPAKNITGSYSFENDMEGWIASAADVEAPGRGGSEPWSITRSQDIANEGTTSVKLFLQNFNDGGKVFIEKPFEVEPGQIYQVHLEYAFASRDLDVIVSHVMAGVLTKLPVDGNDLGPAIKEISSNGKHSNVGYKWLNKAYDFTVRSQQTRSSL
jgi:hypothetical protein